MNHKQALSTLGRVLTVVFYKVPVAVLWFTCWTLPVAVYRYALKPALRVLFIFGLSPIAVLYYGGNAGQALLSAIPVVGWFIIGPLTVLKLMKQRKENEEYKAVMLQAARASLQ